MNIYLDGEDNVGWSIDQDKNHLRKYLSNLRIKETSNIFKAKIIHNLWWNNLLNGKYLRYKLYIKLKKNLLVTTSNFVDPTSKNYELLKYFNDIKHLAVGWICPSTKQKNILDAIGLRTFYFPFSVNLEIFKPQFDVSGKRRVLNKYNIREDFFKNKVVIGSFQRDSLGADLIKPKWQKGPKLCIELLKDLPKEKFVFLLAGPRRHYILNELRKYNIPYIYLGKEKKDDDLLENTIPISDMPSLYSLVDLYLVTSISEGGPKAIMECTTTKTMIFSTDVGLAGDFLNKECVFQSQSEYQRAIKDFISRKTKKNTDWENVIINDQYCRTLKILNEDEMSTRLYNIYKEFIKNKIENDL